MLPEFYRVMLSKKYGWSSAAGTMHGCGSVKVRDVAMLGVREAVQSLLLGRTLKSEGHCAATRSSLLVGRILHSVDHCEASGFCWEEFWILKDNVRHIFWKGELWILKNTDDFLSDVLKYHRSNDV